MGKVGFMGIDFGRFSYRSPRHLWEADQIRLKLLHAALKEQPCTTNEGTNSELVPIWMQWMHILKIHSYYGLLVCSAQGNSLLITKVRCVYILWCSSME